MVLRMGTSSSCFTTSPIVQFVSGDSNGHPAASSISQWNFEELSGSDSNVRVGLYSSIIIAFRISAKQAKAMGENLWAEIRAEVRDG